MSEQQTKQQPDDNRFEVQHRAAQSRYTLIDRGDSGDDSKEIGEEQYLDLTVDDSTHRIMHHTAVSEEYGGQGLASQLVRYAVEQTIADGAAVVPVCPYVAKWLEKHADYSAHVVAVRPEHLRALRS